MSEALIQGSDEWRQARLGKVGASRVSDVIAKTKSGWGTSRANLMAELLAERLTGNLTEGYTNAAMQWGVEKEPEARAAYEFYASNAVTAVGFVEHPALAMTGASPDGLIADDGLLEIKCPNTAHHIERLTGQPIAARYITQMQWQMACTGRRWCDFVSYDPRMPEQLRLWTRRVERDSDLIFTLEKEVGVFLTELNSKEAQLRNLMGE